MPWLIAELWYWSFDWTKRLYVSEDGDFIQESAVYKKSETHGGEDVAIYASGPMSHLFTRTVEQNYIFHVMAYSSCKRLVKLEFFWSKIFIHQILFFRQVSAITTMTCATVSEAPILNKRSWPNRHHSFRRHLRLSSRRRFLSPCQLYWSCGYFNGNQVAFLIWNYK